MSSEQVTSVVVYHLTDYFWQQPTMLKCCPRCGKLIVSVAILPSKAVASELALGIVNIPAHYFSTLYRCQVCAWWAIRESWALLEAAGTNDYLIVAQEDSVTISAGNIAPWEQVLDDLHIYQHSQPLPEHLAKLFIGGKSYPRAANPRT